MVYDPKQLTISGDLFRIINDSSSWDQFGQDIYGDQPHDKCGIVSLSNDGTILAVGAVQTNSKGYVKVYEFKSGNWVQIGPDIKGDSINDLFGSSLSLSSDGKILAVGAIQTNSKGYVKVYEFENLSWNQLGNTFYGEVDDNDFGWSVSLSSNGKIIAIGEIRNLNNSGYVSVYEFENLSWNQLGNTFYGETSNQYFGHSVSLSSDGTILAFGVLGYNSFLGVTRIYKYDYTDNSWNILGSDIYGESPGDTSGYSVSLSSDGTIVAIGATQNTGEGAGVSNGHIQVYEFYSESESWIQKGQDLDSGIDFLYFGFSVALSSDGIIVAGGGTGGGGKVGIYEFYSDSESWVQKGSYFNGYGSYDNFGRSLSLSSDGTIVAIGGIYNNINGTESGFVQVYKLNKPLIVSIVLTPENIITDLYVSLEIELRFHSSSSAPSITIEPSYIAYLDGSMNTVDNLNWTGTIKRTEGMNRLDNTITVEIDDLSGEISFDVVENLSSYKNKFIKSFGKNTHGQLGLGSIYPEDNIISLKTVPGISNVLNLEAGNNFTFILLKNNILMSCGDFNSNGLGKAIDTPSFEIVPNISNISSFSCGSSHTIVLLNDGTIMGSGSNIYGQLGLGNAPNPNTFIPIPDISNVTQVICGGSASFILLENGTLMSCGYNAFGTQGLGDIINYYTFQPVPDVSNVIQVSTHANTIILLENGTIMSSGLNRYGELGLGDTVSRNVFLPVPDISNVIKVYSRPAFVTFILLENGTIMSCGYNLYGQLGLGDNINYTTFQPVPGVSNVLDITGSEDYTFILLENGTIMSCGRNNSGQLGLGLVDDTTDRNIFQPVENISNVLNIHNSIYSNNMFLIISKELTRQISDISLNPLDITTDNTNFEILFTTNDVPFSEISGNVILDPSNVATISNLRLTNHGFKLEGTIEANELTKSDINKLKYTEIMDSTNILITGGSTNVPYYTYSINGSETINAETDIILPISQSYTFTRTDSGHPFKIGENGAISGGTSIELTYTDLQDATWECTSHFYMSGGFQFEDYNIQFSINTLTKIELLNRSLIPENIIGQDASSVLRIEFNIPINSDQGFNIVIDPSYIVTRGTMTDVSGGYVWEETLTNVTGKNRLNNRLDFSYIYDGLEVSANFDFDVYEDVSYYNFSNDTLIHTATIIENISDITFDITSFDFTIQLTTNDVSLTSIESNLTIDPSNIGTISNHTLTNDNYTLSATFSVIGEQNNDNVKIVYGDYSSNTFNIYSIQDLSINVFAFDNSAVTYENYETNSITLTLNRSDLANIDISNSFSFEPSNCGQIIDVSGTGFTRQISVKPTFFINEPVCNLTFHYTQSNPYLDASMTIPFSVDTSQYILDVSLNPRSILEPNYSSNFGIKFRIPFENEGKTPDITIEPSYIANVFNNPAISGDTWNGTIQRSQNKNRLYNTIDFSYNGFDTSLNFNVAQNPELIIGPREIGDYIECKGIKISSLSLTEDFTVSEVEIFDYSGLLVSTGTFSNSSDIDSAFIINETLTDTTTLTNSGEKWFQIQFDTNKKIKEITIYASHSVKIELFTQTQSGVLETITNLGQLEVVDIYTSATINITNASKQSTVTRTVKNISLDPSNIIYPDSSCNFEMLFSTNDVSLSDISNTYLSIDPSNVANLTNLSLIENGFKLVGKIEANENIFEEDCKLKYFEGADIDISGQKEFQIKDMFIRNSSIMSNASYINFENNVGNLELEFTLEKTDLSLNDFTLDNSATITNLTQNELFWNADITFPYTENDISVNYNIVINYKSGYSHTISETYNTYIPIVGDQVKLLDIYNEVPEPQGNNLDISLNENTILTSGSSSERKEKREVFIERLLDTYKDNLKNTTEKLVMKTDELLGTNSGINKEKIKIIDNFDTDGNKLTDIEFNTKELSGDEAVYVPLNISGQSIILDTFNSKLKVEKISDTSYNVYEDYNISSSSVTKIMTNDETDIYDYFKYKIGSIEGENLPAIIDISLNPPHLVGNDVSANIQVTFSQPAIEPIITIDPSYIAYLDGSMVDISGGYIWSGTIIRTLEMNRLNNLLDISGEYHHSSISFDVVEDNSYLNADGSELIRIVKPISNLPNIEYPNTSNNFEILFTTNDVPFSEISGNVTLDPSNVATISNLRLTNHGFKLEGTIEANELTKSDTNCEYFETNDISGEFPEFKIYSYPPFEILNCSLTPQNIVGQTDASSNLQIEFNFPIPIEASLNDLIIFDPSYIIGNFENMTSTDGKTWNGTVTKKNYMNKLDNKLNFNYTYLEIGINDEDLTVSAELIFDILENKDVLRWEKKMDTNVNEVFDETVEISPNGEIMALISDENVKIYKQSTSNWSLVKEISGNNLALCDNRIAIGMNNFVKIYHSDNNWSQNGNDISASNVSNLAISNDGNKVAYVYDISSVNLFEYSIINGWSDMNIVGVTGNNVKFSPNGLLLGVGTLDDNQNFINSNVILYEYSESNGWIVK